MSVLHRLSCICLECEEDRKLSSAIAESMSKQESLLDKARAVPCQRGSGTYKLNNPAYQEVLLAYACGNINARQAASVTGWKENNIAHYLGLLLTKLYKQGRLELKK